MKNKFKQIFENILTLAKIKILATMALALLAVSCSVEPQPINYGSDNCEYCKMTIMDPKFAAEVVTEKGKAYKFDAIECMFRYMHDETFEKDNISLYLINTLDKPSELYDAKHATYLISHNLPSPMGAFLSGYISRSSAEKMQKEKDGTIFDFDELNELFHKKHKESKSGEQQGEHQGHEHDGHDHNH